jgi:hypothetical protein
MSGAILHGDVLAMAESVEAAPSDLLTRSSPKTEKGENYGWLTGILYLAPHKAAGFNVCGSATLGCIDACLNTAGQGSFNLHVHRARIRKTKWFRADKKAFMLQLERDILRFIRAAKREDLRLCIRLNGTSDIPFENVRVTFSNGFTGTIFDRFPDVQFYDYTKHALRFGKPLPANYDLTFSLADGNSRAADLVLANGGRVAVVFRNANRPNAQARKWNLPDSWNGRAMIDADAHDLRFLEPAGVYCGLKAKGQAWKDTTGFVHDIQPV